MLRNGSASGNCRAGAIAPAGTELPALVLVTGSGKRAPLAGEPVIFQEPGAALGGEPFGKAVQVWANSCQNATEEWAGFA